jgi:hypothetical protein
VRKLLIVNSIETDKAGIKLSSKFLISTLMISQLGINRCPILGDFGKKGCGIELAVLATAPTWEWGARRLRKIYSGCQAKETLPICEGN